MRKRVNTYFKTNNKSRNANATMVIKTVIMLSLFLIPLLLLSSGSVTSVGLLFTLYILSGLGMSGIGMGVVWNGMGVILMRVWYELRYGYSLVRFWFSY